MGVHGGVTNQLVIAFNGIEVIEIDPIKVVGIPMIAFDEVGHDLSRLTVGGHQEKVVVALL